MEYGLVLGLKLEGLEFSRVRSKELELAWGVNVVTVGVKGL